jgi:hypothetical protein
MVFGNILKQIVHTIIIAMFGPNFQN